jgi:L-fucose isomerase
MSNTATVLAFDFGASSGRAIRAVYDGQNLTYEEIHRFENIPIEKDGHLCWNVETLLKEIHTAIQKAGTFDSLGFDTWGVDFGLLDADGHLLANPVHYRDSGATALDGSGACVDAKGNHVMKPFWEMTDADIKACLDATDWCRADYEYFRGGGYSSHFRCKAEMPVTMLRFNIVEGIGPVLQIAEGWTADLPDEIHNTIDKRTDPTWPTTWFCPRLTGQGAFTDVYSVMANWGANHGVTVYGHVGADLITLASMLRIPVTMHNVPAEKVYRPHAWASFGTQDQQAADYAACKQYGPLYR